MHNKISSDHTIAGKETAQRAVAIYSDKSTAADCRTYLLALSAAGGKCSGEINSDTKGGTWQVGNNGISYHALAYKTPPKQDAINKPFRGAALQAQSINKGGSAPLNPWPLDSLDSVKPTVCHSHNDYDGELPLYGALSAGCIGIEVDVWYLLGNLLIGHTLPTPGRTLAAQYIQPLRAILDHRNGGSPGSKGIYAASPSQSVVLMIDFKSSDSRTLDAVNAALQPLREGGYLSRLEDGRFVEKQITAVASGSSSFERISTGDGVPNRDIFYDAKIGEWGSQYTNLNSYYASADFQDVIGNPSNASSFTDAQKDKVRQQVEQVHSADLNVRYCEFPPVYP